MREAMADEHGGDDAGTPIEFRPSAEAAVVPDGPRDLALVFLGASLVAGVGDPKGQGWVTRVVGRTQHPDVTVTAYNLGVRGDTSAELLERWASEVPRRWAGRTERRLVVSCGGNDIASGVTLARHRLNLANLLDDAASQGSRPSSSARRPRTTTTTTRGSRCSSTPRPTSAPGAACPSSTATPR
ncbi:GDSL-type esterase/lipase family protein [Phycicoccus sp. HDW14]|uniref:GDSL-type esterase/lipase family protein n=1 Tax=Phycicoccus sp. HDW14 TaxID=2714941 RepID=UPI00353005D7